MIIVVSDYRHSRGPEILNPTVKLWFIRSGTGCEDMLAGLTT
jgi:hypothetical protein